MTHAHTDNEVALWELVTRAEKLRKEAAWHSQHVEPAELAASIDAMLYDEHTRGIKDKRAAIQVLLEALPPSHRRLINISPTQE